MSADEKGGTKRLYSAEAAAASLEISVRQLENLRRAGDITPVGVRSQKRYTAEELDRYVESLPIYTGR